MKEIVRNSESEFELNEKSLVSPTHILHYLNLLTDHLQKYGFYLHCIPLFYLIDLILSELVPQSESLQVVNLLKQAKLFTSLRLDKLAESALLSAESIGLQLTPELKSKFRYELLVNI